ncbi:MAG: DUF935 family protein [Deltaproteobacteria bacterium]|nr:DUF935 family protein [Deltaproteobacteria bacterium]
MLLDQFGREIKSNKPILQEVAVSGVRDRYDSYPSQGLTPQRLAAIFKDADQGHLDRQAELFGEMEEKDLHLGGILQTRKLAVSGLEWDILPASESAEDKKIAQAAAEMIEYLENFEDGILDMLDAIGKAFAVQEIMWDMSEGQVWAKDINWISQRRFTFGKPDGLLLKTPKLLTDEQPIWGEDLLPNKFVLHKYRARSGATPRGGILRPCAYMYLFKNFDIKDWVIFNELFAVPMRVGKYKPEAGTSEKEALKRAVFNLGVDAAAVIADNTLIEILETKLRGDAGTFSSLAEFCDRAMSKGVLGHTGSAESTSGRLGGEVAAENVRQDLKEADSRSVEKTVKMQVLAPWVVFNFGPGKGVPIFKIHYEADEDLETIAKVYGILVKDAGFEGIPESHIHDRFSIPVPDKGEKTLRPAQPAQPQAEPGQEPAPKPAANKALIMINAAIDPTDAWIDFYMKQLAPHLSNARMGALDEIETWLKSLPTPPEEAAFVSHIEDVLGASAATAIGRNVITDTVAQIYTAFRETPGVTLSFGGPDIRAINFLGTLDHYYTSGYLKNPDAQNVMRAFIQERYLEKVGGLFGRGNPDDIAEFRNLLGQKVADLEDWQIRRIVETSVQRTRNWAAVSQMHEGGVTQMEVYEPTRDCAFCAAMNGQVISVATAYAVMERQADMTPDEYEADLRASTAELNRMAQAVDKIEYTANAGRIPPYHPHCRGMIIKKVR